MHVVSMQGIPGLSGEKGRLGLPGEKVQKQIIFIWKFYYVIFYQKTNWGVIK